MKVDAAAVPGLISATRELSPLAFLQWALETFRPEEGIPTLAFASSLGLEDQLLLSWLDELLAGSPHPAEAVHAFTLDTGRLPAPTYTLLQTNHERFRLRLKAYWPEAAAVEAMVSEQGPNLFYSSLEARKACCHVRKVSPLERALSGRAAWITGLRRSQSVTRTQTERVEWDQARGIVKLNPLLDWNLDQVQSELTRRHVPINALHAQGYPSLGCEPCTRAVQPGEDERAGRWWWESADKKECGLHTAPGSGNTPTFRFGTLP